jgi:hypothetical protein
MMPLLTELNFILFRPGYKNVTPPGYKPECGWGEIQPQHFGIFQKDRRFHAVVIGLLRLVRRTQSRSVHAGEPCHNSPSSRYAALPFRTRAFWSIREMK